MRFGGVNNENKSSMKYNWKNIKSTDWKSLNWVEIECFVFNLQKKNL
jgi:hypothetical protein